MRERLARLHPQEGLVTVGLVYVLAVVLGLAVDEPSFVNGKGSLTDGLALAAVLGATVGLVGPKVGWGRWTTHLVGALFAGLLLPILAGWAYLPGTSVDEAFMFTARDSVQAYLDLAWRNMALTSREVHYTLVLSVLMWGTMQFASYAVFGHRRPLAAVIVVGLLLALNMAVTKDQLLYLLLYTTASLFLLIQMHAFDERSTWIRRRIGDPAQLSALYLRGGAVFIVLAMTGSLLLTTRAASAPLAGAWDGAVDTFYDIGEELARFLPAGADVRGGGGVSFGESARILPKWFSDDAVAFTATTSAAVEGLRWRAKTYDTFTGTALVQSQPARVSVAAGQPLLAGWPEEPNPELTTQVEVSVTPFTFRDSLVLAPGTPVSVSRDADVMLFGTDGWLAGVDLSGGRDNYQVVAAVPLPEDQELVTQNRLRVAGTSYPPDVTARYTAVADGVMGNDARELLATIRELVPDDNPYDVARTIETFLRSDENFNYDPDLTDNPCEGSAVECFARVKRGYCLHYAATMAMLLRAWDPENRIPTRIAQGFLPGETVGSTTTFRNLHAHAWVEVYFPNYGWIEFDPTGGGVGIPSVLPPGPVVTPLPSASARPSLGPGGAASFDTDFLPDRSGNLPPIRPNQNNGPLFAAIALLVLFSVVGLAVAAWLRGPRGEVSPDSAWQGLSKTASRFGFAPRPTQTVYEYAASLGELVPTADADLQTVATAKVETSYARVRLPGGRLEAVRDATRRLRVSMLRLMLRRPRHRR